MLKENLKKSLVARRFLIPSFISNIFRQFNLFYWVKRDLLSPFKTPTFVKQKILLKHSIKKSTWIETGTYIGETTGFLAERFPIIHTIEPSNDCMKIAKTNLAKFNNIKYHFGTSEDILPELLSKLSGNLCLWLDGHFSSGITFCGDNECPIKFELEAIYNNKKNFDNIAIFIDDITAGFTDSNNYPRIDFYVDWARKNKFNWFIEQGIFILKSENLSIY